jgi:basic membrane lipoprotein Med (substrate-binding protein (PBP1-ABC) superfamily)
VVPARWTALVAVVAIAAGLFGSGCGGRSGTRVTKVALLTPGSTNDPEWSTLARERFEALVNRLHVRGAAAESPPTSQLAASLEQLSNGTQLVIAHESSYARAAASVAEKTKVPELVWGDRAATKPGRVADVEIDGGPAGYLAGLISSRASLSKRLAVVLIDEGTPWERTTWNTMAGGFIAGARSIDPKVRIWLRRLSPAEAPSTIRRLVIKNNIQTVFVLAGVTSTPMYRMLEKQILGERFYVGLVGPKDRINQENIILTSILYDFTGVFRQAIADVRSGRFGEHPYALTLANRGLSLQYTGRTPSDTYDAALAAQRKLVARQISVPSTPTEASVDALLEGTLRQ